MQNFITEHKDENVSSILKIVNIYNDTELWEDDNLVWLIESTYKGKYLPRMRQYFQGYKIPSMNWDFMDESGLTIPKDGIDIETKLVIRSVKRNLAENYQIAIEEIKEFHEKRKNHLNEQINYFMMCKEGEIKEFNEFSVEWEQ